MSSVTDVTTTPANGRSSATRLAQIVAIVGGAKTRAEQALTASYHQIQKPAPFAGISRTYQPRDDEGEHLPAESTRVQVRADDLIESVRVALSRMFDVVATQDWANTTARADLVVDGQTLIADIPVTYLMWLEKQVGSLRTFISKLPVLDVAESWTYDDNARAYATTATQTTKTKKVPRNHVKAPATEQHPAQVDVWMEDIIVGDWTTVRYSGALPAATVFAMAERVDKLIDGIRFAREQANAATVTDVTAGDPILSYVFGS